VHQRVNGQIDIEIWLVQMMRTGQLDPADLPNRRVLEPWKVLESYEQFLITKEEPKTVRRHIRDFNLGSALPKRPARSRIWLHPRHVAHARVDGFLRAKKRKAETP
jgi:hypothetical protein